MVYEAGIANLTKPETTMLIHYGPEKTQQWTLIRIENKQQQAMNGTNARQDDVGG